MNDEELRNIALWLSRQGYEGMDETELIAGFCARCNAAGMRIARVLCLIDTLHPEFEGRAFQWDSLNTVSPVVEYAPTKEGRARDVWEASVFHALLYGDVDEIRRQFAKGAPADFYNLQDLKDDGHTDYVAMIHRFTDHGRVGEMDAFSSHWTTRDENGFDEDSLTALRTLLPTLALAIKCASSIRIIGTLAEIYLGRDAGRKVVSGQINRGEVEKIDAVIWFSDLHDYTRISDGSDPEQIIPFLNDYAELVIGAVHAHGGNVLKLIGDGILAIFRSGDQQVDCMAALDAERAMHSDLKALNARRMANGLPTTAVYLGLHVGEVFYGNIGGRGRLDFTVVGPAVNQVSRISSLCT